MRITILLLVGALLLSPELFAQDKVPAGTILPVLLTSTLSPERTKPHQLLSARVMQDVPLPNGRTIRAGDRVTGHVLDVLPGVQGTPARISFVFDKLIISKVAIPIATDLRALAGPVEVDSAQVPLSGPDRGTPANAWVTDQVGGDTVYRGGGHVMNGLQVVGEPVSEGVLVHLTYEPGSACRGEVDSNAAPQALWVFSSDACGLYGYPHLSIAHAGRTDPVGVISLSSQDHGLKIWSGSGMLLRVN
jgi:hypothetical protein